MLIESTHWISAPQQFAIGRTARNTRTAPGERLLCSVG